MYFKYLLILLVVGTNILSAVVQEKFSNIYLHHYPTFFIFYFSILFIMFLRFLGWYFLHKNYLLSSTYIVSSSFFVIIYIISIFYYDEIITISKVIGCLLIIFGIFFIERNKSINKINVK